MFLSALDLQWRIYPGFQRFFFCLRWQRVAKPRSNERKKKNPIEGFFSLFLSTLSTIAASPLYRRLRLHRSLSPKKKKPSGTQGMADPDLRVSGGPDHPDSKSKRGAALENTFSQPFRPWFGLKIRWGLGPSPRSATDLLSHLVLLVMFCLLSDNNSQEDKKSLVLWKSRFLLPRLCLKNHNVGPMNGNPSQATDNSTMIASHVWLHDVKCNSGQLMKLRQSPVLCLWLDAA